MSKAPRPRKLSRTPFLRVLPALIFVGVLMLSVRVTDIWKGVPSLEAFRLGGELQAQQSPKGAAQDAAQAPAETKPEGTEGPGAPGSAPGSAAPPAASAAPPPQAGPAPAAGIDQGAMSQTELDVLQKLQERRAALDVRERDVERRESLLKAAEGQIERKLSEMKTLQGTIEGLLRQYNDQEDNKMRSLVKIYENMKPKEAAKIFEQLDMTIMLEVVERMKEQKVAPILAEMDPARARNLTSELAQRRQIPIPKGGTGG